MNHNYISLDIPVSFTTAKLLVDVNYPPTLATDFYMDDGLIINDAFHDSYRSVGLSMFAAPTFGTLQRWLRIQHNLYVSMATRQEWDYMNDLTTVIHVVMVSDWNRIISTHDGTGLQLPMHWHAEGDDYDTIYAEGLVIAVRELKRSQKD